MQLTVNDIARMMDLSAVKTDSDLQQVRRLADQAKKYNCICAYVMPCFVRDLKAMLDDAPEVCVGVAVGFPAGANTTAIKAAETRELVADGAGELDMVMNVGMLRSKQYAYVENDIKAVIDAADGTLLKVIIECHYLTDDEIKRASEICVRSGADFVKTGSGWTETGATPHNVALIKSVVGDGAKVKASGGVTSLDTLVQLYQLGATRFGVNLKSGVTILEACAALPGGVAALSEIGSA